MPAKALKLLFGLTLPVDRRTYAIVGVMLMVLKLGVDQLFLYVATGKLWGFWQYLSLGMLSDQVPSVAIGVLTLWALPFAWIGLSMTVRRAIDAGLSPWVGLLFCVPLINLVLMIALCFRPSRPQGPRTAATARESPTWMSSRLTSIGASLAVAMAVTAVSVFAIRDLGVVLFAGTPLGMGVVAGYTFNRGIRRELSATLGIAGVSLIAAAAVLMLFAIEGLVCLAMALPLAAPLILLGAILGRSVALGTARHASPLMLLLLVLPLAAWVEPSVRSAERVHRVTSSLFIDATPEDVWPYLISFEPLAPPRELYFRLGIAYPQRARIEGRGVGAIRYCEFSTGSFVEPITVWDEPRKLAFDVTSQPEPLRELSPYPYVYSNHLDGSFTSKRGEFVLKPGPEGGTILEGSTWYQLSLFPGPYWTLWSDFLIRAIHLRVLDHVKTTVEQG